LSKSKVWIDNYRKPYGTVKRGGQFYLNTWHGDMGFKPIGLWREKAFSEIAKLVSENDSKMINAVIVDSKYCEKMFVKGLIYDGLFYVSGLPRCDVYFRNRDIIKRELRKQIGILEDANIVMYAPTFREIQKDGKRRVLIDENNLDVERLLLNLQLKFGGNWYFAIRFHPQIAEDVRKKIMHDNIRVLDFSKEDDMYELLCGTDAFITDYSSAAFEAGYMGIPVFIFAHDIEQYTLNRGDFLWKESKQDMRYHSNEHIVPEINAILPFSISKNNDELENNLLRFEKKSYEMEMEKLKNDIGLVFDGKASYRAANIIEDYLEKRK